MKGEGAIVFLIVFVVFLLATIAYPALPPGGQLYGLLGVPETEYLVLGIPASTLVSAVFNGVVFGVIAWLIFTFVKRGRKPQKPETKP